MDVNTIVLASRNKKKIAELEAILKADLPETSILSLDDIGLEGEIEENGLTFEENALIKARAARVGSGGRLAGVGDDSDTAGRSLLGAGGFAPCTPYRTREHTGSNS